MLFNVLCLFLIVAITLYLATQGMLSSLLALTTATFSSILAMALMEPLHGLMAGYRPAFARGATLLLVFLRLRPPPPHLESPRGPGHLIRTTEPASLATATMSTCFGPLARLR